MNFLLITIVVIIFFAIIISVYKKRQLGATDSTSATDASTNTDAGAAATAVAGEDKLEKRNLFGKDGVKLISYKEALEASKQFIFDITRSVMQRFTPDSKRELSDVGRKLLQSGMQYFHVVDIFSLSLQKQRGVAVKKQEGPAKGTGI